MLGWYGFNTGYFLFMLPGLLISLWASSKVKRTFAVYRNVRTLSGLTGALAARRILDGGGLARVPIERVAGELSDHYDPRAGVVRLSAATYDSPSVGAVGVAAHECGHALQHALGYGPARLRGAIVPLCNVGTRLSVPLIFAGYFLSITGLIWAGIALFSLAVLFQLVTLPVEFDASRRAVACLSESGMVSPEENEGVKKVLAAAALTYLAALLTSLLQLIYFLGLAGRRRR